jgi:hypothetical protein
MKSKLNILQMEHVYRWAVFSMNVNRAIFTLVQWQDTEVACITICVRAGVTQSIQLIMAAA